MDVVHYYITFLIPLLIIMDPIGNLPLFLLFTQQNTPKEQRRIAAISCGTACVILIFFALTGDYVLRLFRISLPAFQLAGGFIFFAYALQMLGLIPGRIKTTTQEEEEGIAKENVALVPLATPLLAGPGAITAVLVWQQSPGDLKRIPLLLTAIITACLMVYVIFYFGKWIRKIMGVGGIGVATRLMGLLLAVIAVQFMVGGFNSF